MFFIFKKCKYIVIYVIIYAIRYQSLRVKTMFGFKSGILEIEECPKK